SSDSRTSDAKRTVRWRACACRWACQRPPPPPPPPPPPEKPPPPPPEEPPGGVADEAIRALRPLPIARVMPPRSPTCPPWYQVIAAVVAAAAAAPTARVNFFVQASSTSSATEI